MDSEEMISATIGGPDFCTDILNRVPQTGDQQKRRGIDGRD
jgi:hypothetical protein